MADFDVVIDKTVDQFLLDEPSYVNSIFTKDDLFVSEGATLSQTVTETEDYLYAVDVVLGENSTGTAVLKEGYLDLTKPGFTLYLTLGAGGIDLLSPAAAILTIVTAQQFRSSPEGETTIGISWDLPTLSELYSQRCGPITGSAQSFDLIFDPISTDSETVYEITGYGATSTALAYAFESDHDILRVVSLAGFSSGDVVEVSGGGDTRYYEVVGLHASGLVVNTRCNISTGFPIGSTVKTVTKAVKTKGVDYTLDYSLGILSLLAGQFSPTSEVAVFYTPLLQDLDHFELYRVNGNEPVDPSNGHSRVTRDAVLGHPSSVGVDTHINSASVGYSDALDASHNGDTRTYYLFSVDDAASPNYSYPAIVMVETIPSIPTNPFANTSSERVELYWDDLPSGSDDNTDGFNVYRCDGAVFDAATCVKVNSDLIDKTISYFDDSDNNTTDRRPPSEVPYPQNGLTYSYKIESEDTVTTWDTGTKNEDAETGTAVLVASKTV
jgi:hypothetical protein